MLFHPKKILRHEMLGEMLSNLFLGRDEDFQSVCKIEGKGDDDCRLLRKGVMNAADNDKLHDFTLDEQLCWHGCCTATQRRRSS